MTKRRKRPLLGATPKGKKPGRGSFAQTEGISPPGLYFYQSASMRSGEKYNTIVVQTVEAFPNFDFITFTDKERENVREVV